MTSYRTSVLAALLVLALLLAVIELIRRRRLQERYALLWLGTGLVMMVLALWRGSVRELGAAAGIAYPPSALLLLGFLFALVLLLHASTAISGLSEQNTTLAQRLAILEAEVARVSPPRDHRPEPDPGSSA